MATHTTCVWTLPARPQSWGQGSGRAAGTRPVVTVQRAFVLGFDIFLDSMLQFSFGFFCFFLVYNFVFPGGGEKDECLQSFAATHLTVFTFANVDWIWFCCVI